MAEISLTSIALTKRLPLDKIADYFRLHKPLRWKDYIVLQDAHLEVIFKYVSSDKSIYVFDFGAITFVNLTLHEIRIIMDYLQSIIGSLSYNPLTDSLDGHTLVFNEKNECRLWPDSEDLIPYNKYILPIAAEILAQSVALETIENTLYGLIDDASLILARLNKGKLRANSRKIVKMTGKIIRFQHNSVESIHIFDRPSFCATSTCPKEVHDQLAEHYELYDRFHIIEDKSNELLHIVQNYLDLSNKKAEYRLYVLEAFLLFLFPLKFFVGKQVGEIIGQFIHQIENIFR